MRLRKHLPTMILLLFGALMCFLVCYNHYSFKSYAYDYANYNRGFWEYAHFKSTPISLIASKEMSFFQDHFSLTFIFLVPFYWTFNWIFGTYTILILQSVFIVWGGWAVYQLVWERSKKMFPAIVSLLLYFLLFGRYSALTCDSNLMIILSSFVPVFLLYFQRGKMITASLCFLFLIFGRESVPLWTFFIGLLLLLENRKNPIKRKWSVIFMLASLFYFILVMKVLIPLTENPECPFSLFDYSNLGQTPGEALVFLITHPIESLDLLISNFSGDPYYDNVKSEFAFIYLLSGGLLLFIKPKYLIPFIPIVAQKMFNDAPLRWGTSSYYAIEFVSVMPIFIGYVLADIRWQKLRVTMGSLVLFSCIWITLHKMDFANRAINWGDGNKSNITKSEYWKSEHNVSSINDVLTFIPENANIAADTHLAPHLAQRDKIKYFPFVDESEEYIVFFKKGTTFLIQNEKYDQIKTEYLNHNDYSIFKENKDVVLLKIKD